MMQECLRLLHYLFSKTSTSHYTKASFIAAKGDIITRFIDICPPNVTSQVPAFTVKIVQYIYDVLNLLHLIGTKIAGTLA